MRCGRGVGRGCTVAFWFMSCMYALTAIYSVATAQSVAEPGARDVRRPNATPADANDGNR